MGYTHYFKKQRTPTAYEWNVIQHIADWVIANAPLRSSSAGGHFKGEPLRGALITYVESRDPLTGQFSDTSAFLTHEPPNALQEMDGKPAIIFDGHSELGHETFILTKASREIDERSFLCLWFCKTARKPYDLLVCATLILIDHHAPGWLKIESDGNPDDWEPALQYARLYDENAMLPVGIDPDQTFSPKACDVEEFTNKQPSQFIDSNNEPGLFF